MKLRSIFFVLVLIATIVSCSKTPYKPDEKPDEKPEDKPFVQAPKIEGRIVNAYVTYYGNSIPDPNLVTHVNYAFAELYVVDGEYKGFKLQGREDRFRSVVDLKKKNPNLKICISFTHVVDNPDNRQGGGFSAMSSTQEGREAFANDCLEFINKWGIDGVDIDWELPGISWSGHACDVANDTQNHVLLMKQLRETLGKDKLLTYAGYIRDKLKVTGGYKYVDIRAVDSYVDFVNIMTYDLDEAPKHHSALKDSRAYWDCNRAIGAYFGAGIKPNKLVLGIPFFGRRSFSKKPTALKYKSILALDKDTYVINNWDSMASVPYVTLKSNGSFYCGYDNAQSIAIKGDWAISLGLCGMMCWEADADDSNQTLLKAMWNGVMEPK